MKSRDAWNRAAIVSHRPLLQAYDAKRAQRDAEREAEEAAQEERFVAYVPLPDAQEIEARVLESKKAALMSKYASEALQQEQERAKALLQRR